MQKIHVEGDPKLKNTGGKQYSMFVGRFQPFHAGHRWIVDEILNEGKKKLEKWEYVPCEKCFKKNKRNKLKEGTSEIGFILYSIMDLLEQRRNNESN